MQDCTYTAFLLPVTAVFRVPKYDWSWVTVLDVVAGALLKLHMYGCMSGRETYPTSAAPLSKIVLCTTTGLL